MKNIILTAMKNILDESDKTDPSVLLYWMNLLNKALNEEDWFAKAHAVSFEKIGRPVVLIESEVMMSVMQQYPYKPRAAVFYFNGDNVIIVNSAFMRADKDIQEPLIAHEIGHLSKDNKYLTEDNARRLDEEIWCDNYAAEIVGKKAMLAMLCNSQVKNGDDLELDVRIHNMKLSI
ncbi:MAG TPA: hypothetical protein HPP97_10285 [Desulfuromonadales bacterium]|nr:hypothetical protein [Desulfuromonadales bacterium]